MAFLPDLLEVCVQGVADFFSSFSLFHGNRFSGLVACH